MTEEQCELSMGMSSDFELAVCNCVLVEACYGDKLFLLLVVLHLLSSQAVLLVTSRDLKLLLIMALMVKAFVTWWLVTVRKVHFFFKKIELEFYKKLE